MNNEILYSVFRAGDEHFPITGTRLNEVDSDLVSDYPWVLGISVRLRNADAHGLPSNYEQKELNEFEDGVEAVIKKMVPYIFALRLTSRGIREVIYYTSKEIDIKQLGTHIEETNNLKYEFVLKLESDEEWSRYFDWSK